LGNVLEALFPQAKITPKVACTLAWRWILELLMEGQTTEMLFGLLLGHIDAIAT
jgi:hypothetical protein